MRLFRIIIWPLKMLVWLSMIPAFRPRVVGRENAADLKSGKTLIIANHTSKWDAVFIDRYLYREKLRFMGKNVIFEKYGRAYAWFLRRLGIVKVEQPGTGMGWLVKGTELLRAGETVCMFPAGDRSFGGEVLPFRPGFIMLALNAGAAILPVYIDWRYGIFQPVTVIIGRRFELATALSATHPYHQQIEALSDFAFAKVMELQPQGRRGYFDRRRP